MNLLDKLDDFFENQKDTEQKLTFFMAIALMFFISYYFIYPITDEMYENSMQQNRSLNREISSKQTAILQFKNSIIRYRQGDQKLKSEIKELAGIEVEMKKLLHKVRFLIFNLDRWADIYNQIPHYVRNSNLLLLQLDNQLSLDDKNSKNKNLVNLKMQIKLKVVGEFPNIVKLLNIFESRKDLVKIVFLETDGQITDITINVYGAEL